MSREIEDVGNEFANPMDAVQSAVEGEAPVAEEPTTQAEEIPNVEGTWADQPENSEEGTEPEAPEAPTQATLEIKGGKGTHKFDLSPDNEELQRTLKLGLGARQWQKERDEARQAAKGLESQISSLSEKAKVWDELEALSRRGHTEQVVRAVLGEKGFKQFMSQAIEEFGAYSDADPETRAEIERRRQARDQDWTKYQAERKEAELTAKLQEYEDRVERDRLRSLGTGELKRHDFRGFVKDNDLAHSLNQKLWKLAWADLEDQVGDDGDISPEQVAKAFAQNAKVLRAGMERQTQERVSKVIEQKKQSATKQAQIAASERYPKTATPSGWDGMRSKDLLRKLVRGG